MPFFGPQALKSVSEYNASLVQMYSKHVKNFGEKQANEEMLANFVGENLFGDNTEVTEKLLRTLEPEQRRSFIDMVRDFFAKIKQQFTKNKSATSQIERFEDQFIKAYRAVQAEFEQQKSTAKNNGAEKFSVEILPDKKNHSFAKDGFNYRTAYFMDHDGAYYRITMSVGKNGTINTVLAK